MVDGLKEREWVKDTFGKFMSPEVARHVLSQGKMAPAGSKVMSTILFTDIENYTSISETLTPEETVLLLNEYFNDLIYIVSQNKGVVNKFIGDSVMALFNTPVEDLMHAHNAVKTAIQIQKTTFQKKYLGKHILRTRVGINSGQVVAGNIGAENRLEYTVIGDCVNVAQRLESYNKTTNTYILLGALTYELVKESFPVEFVDEVQLKGKNQKVGVYKLRE